MLTRTRRTWLVAIAVAALVVAANVSHGAYFSQSWGWVALALLVPTTVVLILGVVETPGPLRVALAVATVSLGVWIALSALWSLSPSGSLREAERMLAYVALALAIALLLRRGDAPGVAGGLLAGVALVSGYALATRLFPDRFESFDESDLPYRLSEPVGYWNALGLLAAMGALLGVGVMAHGKRVGHRTLAGMALPVLVLTLYFTFSRGAWVSLCVGFVVTVAIDPRRLELLFSTLVVLPASALVVVLASRQEALTTEDAPLDVAVTEGRRIALAVVALSFASAGLAALASLVARRTTVPGSVARASDVALTSAAVAAVVVGLVAVGGPRGAVNEFDDRFDAPVSVESSSDLNARLFRLSGSGRAELFRVAWVAAREAPVVGQGAGTYEYVLYQDRAIAFTVRDAHSLYAEMLAEVGVVGLTLLSLALLLPVLALLRARRRWFVPALAGTYAAWLVHSAVDWDWEVVGVTATALLAGGACLLAAERGARRALPETGRQLLVVATVVMSAVATVSLVGNQALFAARDALGREEWSDARRHADRAHSLLGWSFEPDVVRGDAAAGLGDRAAALAAYQDARARDPENWVVWLRLAQVAQGDERRHAYARVRVLNPLEPELPGEPGVSD